MGKSYILNNDERNVINRVFDGAEFSKVSKDVVISHIEFMVEATTEPEMKVMLEELIDKIHGLPDSEWENLKLSIPLETDYSFEESAE